MIVPTQTTVSYDARTTALLLLYVHSTGINECAFWGVRPTSETGGACADTIWTKAERDSLAHYLTLAADELEAVLGYPLLRTYFAGERATLRRPTLLRWGHVQETGQRVTDAIATVATDDADLVVLTDVGTSFLAAHEVLVTHAGTTIPVIPSAVAIDDTDGSADITIPRCRLLKPENADNPSAGYNYNDDALFVTEVDVHRVYYQRTLAATVQHVTDCGCDDSADPTSGTVVIVDEEIGAVNVCPEAGTITCGAPLVTVNYVAGDDELSPRELEALRRLAHVKMPYAPCGCEATAEIWRRDQANPEFGRPEAAARVFGHGLRLVRMSVL